MKKLLSLVFAVLIMAGCSAESGGSFKGKEYKLTYAEDGANITLGFSATEDKYYGRAVNNYFGSYGIDGNDIKFGPAGATMMMGPQKLMEIESNYFKTLPKVRSFKVYSNKLVLVTEDGEKLIFEQVASKN